MTITSPRCSGFTTSKFRDLTVATLALLGASCASGTPRPAAPRSICSVETTLGIERAARDRVFPPGYWFALLLNGYQSTGVITRPTTDCRGAPARPDSDGCGGDVAVELAPVLLTPRDLVVVTLGDTRRLVWAVTDHLPDGQAQGPVAIAEVGVRGIAVRAIGTLRTYPENLSLRLERVGTNTVLVAEGEKCAGMGPDCERAVRLLPLLGDRFVSRPIVDDHNVCLGSAFFPVRTKGGVGRRTSTNYALEAAVVFGPEAITIREQLAVTGGHGATSEQAGDSYITRVQSERTLTISGGGLVASGPALLDRWLAQQGAGTTAR